jgi:protein-S-isoprenylcysteine O-methyltransferase Ste14
VTPVHWLELKIPPPVVGALVAGGMWALSDLGPQFALEAGARQVVVGVLVVAGIAIDVLGLLAFRASRTTISPLTPDRSSTLVTGGVYRVTRNPMYLGLALLLLAWAVHLSSLLPLAGLPLFVAYITRFQIRPEERALQERFGEQFAAYAARVRRWL